MSRIADVLKKAQAERGGTELPPGGLTEANPADSADSSRDDRRVPWEIEDRVDAPAAPPVRRARLRRDPAIPQEGGFRRPSGRERASSPDRRMVPASPSPVTAWVHPPDPRDAAGWAPPHAPHTPALLHYWAVVVRRWRIAILVLLVVVGGVSAGVLTQPPVYRASGMLEIRRESTSAVPVDSLFSSEKVTSDDLETQYGILRSVTLAQRVLAQVAGAAPTAAPAAHAAAPLIASVGGGAAVPVSADLGWFREALVINPLRGSRLVEVAFVSENPQQAALMVNSVLDNYLQIRMEEAQRTAGWLEQQLAGAQQRLEQSERQLQAYIRAHGLHVVETGKGEAAQLVNDRLQALQEALAAAQTERMDKQSADDATRGLAASREVDSPVVQNLTVRLADLRREHAKLSSVFHEEYPAVRTLNDQIAELERALAEESQFIVSRGQRDYRAALRKEALLRKALDEQNAVVQALGRRSEGTAGYQSLKRELVTNQEQFGALNQKLKEVSISAALKAQSVGVVDRARTPTRPSGTPLPITLALTTLVGFIVAIGAVFVREHFDTSMRTVEDVETYLGVRTLGAIPAVRGGSLRLGGNSARGALPRPAGERGDRQSPLSEAFASLRNSVLLQEGAGGARVLLVTSAQSEEGKTTVSINLALSLARLGYRVLLIDANMRYPCVQKALGLPDRPGLVDHLAAGVNWRATLHHDARPHLDVLAGGEPQESPADLLSLPAMGDLLDAASNEYDFVLVDSPALLVHPADVHSLAAVADSVLFTVRHGWTPREVVALALSQLGRVSGVVLNRSTTLDIAVGSQDVSRRTLPPVSS